MRELYKRAAPHIDRVRLDGGIPTDNVQDLLLLKRSNEELKSVLRLSYCPELHGNKIRTSGINNFITKGYDEATSNDLTQTASANQPFLDKIAPTEKLSSKSANLTANYLTHTPIVFSATDKWSVEVTLKWNGDVLDYSAFIGSDTSAIRLKDNRINKFAFVNDAIGVGYSNYATNRIAGKNSVLSFVSEGNSTLAIYVNGSLIGTASVASNFSFSALHKGRNHYIDGNIFSYHVFSDALNAQQIAERASILRNIFPEIPFTRIGDQIWSVRNYEAVCTPQGTLISEVQPASNVEKITNGDFSSGTTGWTVGGSGGAALTVTGGVAKIQSTTAGSITLQQSSAAQLTRGKWYKISATLVSKSSGVPEVNFRQATSNITFGMYSGTNTFYTYISTTGVFYFGYGGTLGIGEYIEFDNISIQEIGWSGSQELYDGIYAQTSGTVEEKTYAAVKAAAMWCHYNNDATLGATYGKLYNWFAVKLLQMDIDYFNAANPTTPWGWRVPTLADFNTLATTLGGIAVAGGKMKLSGTTYWNSPNVGADNTSGFSAIGGGIRMEDGTNFATYPTGSFGTYHTLTEETQTTAAIASTSNSHTQLTLVGASKIRGRSLRLIKTT